MTKSKIVFYGSDKYSQIVLTALKRDIRFELVKNPAEAEVGILASYGQILSAAEVAAPKLGILNIHPSRLPKYRGATPVPSAILAGEKEIGVTIIKLDEKIDHGPIVSQIKLAVAPTDTSQTLLAKAFAAGAQELLKILPAYLAGKIELQPQNHNRATLTKRLTREDGQIDWQKSPEYLERFMRAMFPWPGAWTEITIPDRQPDPIPDRRIKRIKILKAHLENGQLTLDTVQLEGKKPVSFKQFREGYPQIKFRD